MLQLAVFVSGSGSNLRVLLDAAERGAINAEISCIIADRECRAREHAEAHNKPFLVVPRKLPIHERETLIREALSSQNCDAIILAGYLGILSPAFCQQCDGRMINLHPSLLPKYGGVGMWGHHVHQAVIDNRDTESGATVHFVSDVVDGGALLCQARCPVLPDDTAATLAARVNRIEHRLLPSAVNLLADRLTHPEHYLAPTAQQRRKKRAAKEHDS